MVEDFLMQQKSEIGGGRGTPTPARCYGGAASVLVLHVSLQQPVSQC